jgi:DNA-binding NarL/FixJ family response regulator
VSAPGGPTVVIADDHELIRSATAEILTAAGFTVVGEAADAQGAVDLVRTKHPGVCLLDISMPGDGVEAARVIAASFPETTVVMLTVLADDDHLFSALRAGARGYLTKGTDPAHMVAALRAVLAGEPGLSPGLAMRILERFQEVESRRVHVPGRGFVQLSPREAEVLDLLRQGMSTSSIARRLGISAATVRTHVAAVLKKLNVIDRRAAVDLFSS